MWEYQQAAAHAASLQLQTASSPASSFPSWSSYGGATTAAALLGAGSAFATDTASSSPNMRLPSAAGEYGHGHAWSQHSEQNNRTGYRENFLDLLASKNVTREMFEDVPAGHHYAATHQTLSGVRLGGSDVAPIKYEATGGSPLFFGNTTTTPGIHHQGMDMVGCRTPCYSYGDHHQIKEGSNQQQELAAPAMSPFLQQLSSNNASVGMHASLDYSGIGLDKICQEGGATEGSSSFGMRSLLPDLSSFSGYRSSNAESPSSVQTYLRSSNLSDSTKQEQDIVPARSSSSGSGAASDRKKRPSEERTTSTGKKSKQEGSKASPPKQQVPKVKIGEKITALQQIVSPFGKTDTASVLFETIKYIKFLHEQVQLLSEPYTNSSRNKGNLPWAVDHHAEGSKQQLGDQAEHDLRDRGLCLVPVSWTPEVYRDGTAMDYWTPAYRGGLYR
ncbi:hypothetical protein HU200_007205 [Digitaria exilis]|uniref:BHLH domain-containing protein n=1 Tax=Digitaria exilis TaxID=1010633 RepID=A0A835KUM2_9POAL|nr:hypothetical protein HU200_007205 [Digitaria exilis]